MNIRILYIHPKDAWFSNRDELLNVKGKASGFEMTGHHLYAFDFVPEHLQTPIRLQFANFERA